MSLVLPLSTNASGNNDAHLDKIMVKGVERDSSLAASYSRFDRDDFFGQYTTLSDFLQQNASVQVRRHGLGNSANLSLRGSTHEQIQFIIDGQVIESAQYGGFDIDQIPLSQIESIEIIKGHHPLANQQAIGGLIKIKRSSAFANKNDLSLSTGNYGQQQIASNHAIPFYGNLFLGVDISEAENNYPTNITSPLNNQNNRNEIQNLNNNHLTSYYSQLKWNSNHLPFGHFSISLESRNREKSIPNYFHNSSDNKALYKKSYQNIHISHEYLNVNSFEFNSNIFYQNNTDRFTDINEGITLEPQDIEYRHDQLQVDHKLSYEIDQHLLKVAISYEQQNYRDDHLLTLDQFKCSSIFANCDIKSQRNIATASFQELWKTNDSLSISLQAGASQAEYEAKEAQTGIKSKDNSIVTTYWGVSFNKLLSDAFTSQLGFNKANRLPTLFELYGDLGAMKGSPSLEPEEAININLDISTRQSALLSLSFFYRDMINSIIATYNSQGIGSYGNAQSAVVYGFEISSKIQWEKVSIQGFSTIKESKTQSNIKSFDNKDLPGIYHQSYSLEFSYQFNRHHKLKWQSLFDNDIYLDESNLNKASNRNINHIKYLFNKDRLIAQIGVNNIFDSTYFDKTNHQAAGRHINMQLTFSY